MASPRDFLRDLADDALERTLGVVRESRFSIGLKTNYGPELIVYRSSGGTEAAGDVGGGGLGDLVGVKGALIVRGAQGQVVTTIGAAPTTDPVRLTALLLLLIVLLTVLVRGVMPR